MLVLLALFIPYMAYGQEINNKVTVEPSYSVSSKGNDKEFSRYYPERRKQWGGTVSLGVGKPEFNDYSTSISSNADFASTYDSEKDLFFDLNITFKRNYSALSLGLNIGVSYAKIGSQVETPDLSVEFTPIRLGFVAALDNVFKKNPYIVPYVGVGAQAIKYNERDKTNDVEQDDTSSISYYVNGGLMFQLDWLHREAGLEGFYESGLQNTFIYIDAINYIGAEEMNSPNLEATLISAGIRIEY